MAAHTDRTQWFRWLGTALVFLLCAAALAAPACAEEAPRGYDSENGYQYLVLGTFPQTLENGAEPILWRILSADSQRIFVVSENVLCNQRIHYDDAAYIRDGGVFEKTEMYVFLNGEFLSHFTAEEQSLMIADGGGPVTLLTRDDLKNKAYGFVSDTARRAYPTPYALQNGLYRYTNGSSPYWTRTQSASHSDGAVCTKENGNLGYIRVVVQNEGCRPALYLDAGLLRVESGTGWFYDPFRVVPAENGGAAE